MIDVHAPTSISSLPSSFTFDVETIPTVLGEKLTKCLEHKLRNISDADEKEAKRTLYRFLDPCYCTIKTIATLYTQNYTDIYEEVFLGSERDIIVAFFEKIKSFKGLFVTFNGFGFDIPLILAKASIYGIKITNIRFSNLIRFRSEPHYDVMAMFGNWGCFKPSLRELSIAFGIDDPKDILEDALVTDFLNTASNEKIAEYCMGDVRATFEIFKRLYPVIH